jgi:hypothetical protein
MMMSADDQCPRNELEACFMSHSVVVPSEVIDDILNIFKRFVPDQYKHQRKYIFNKYHNDPEFKKKWNERTAQTSKKRWEEDPEAYQEHLRKVREHKRDKYRNDPEFREKCKAYRTLKKSTPSPAADNQD